MLLAVALYREQRQDDALSVLRSTREHLRDQSGLDPGPELQTHRAADPGPGTGPLRAPVAATAPVMPVPAIPGVAGQHPLVGRGRPRAVLDAAAEAAESGRATTAVLVGEAGIGKTRLAHAMADDLVVAWLAVGVGERHGGRRGTCTVAVALGRPTARSTWSPWRRSSRHWSRVTSAGAGARDPAADRWRQTQRIGELLEPAARDSPLAGRGRRPALDRRRVAGTARRAHRPLATRPACSCSSPAGRRDHPA